MLNLTVDNSKNQELLIETCKKGQGHLCTIIFPVQQKAGWITQGHFVANKQGVYLDPCGRGGRPLKGDWVILRLDGVKERYVRGDYS